MFAEWYQSQYEYFIATIKFIISYLRHSTGSQGIERTANFEKSYTKYWTEINWILFASDHVYPYNQNSMKTNCNIVREKNTHTN